MSKQRPSTAASSQASARNPVDRTWENRVFKNTFTRAGRRISVKSWSVKIQHRGVRRTLRLSATNRTDAALEARALHQAITTGGWETVTDPSVRSPAAPRPDPDRAASRTEARHWQQRLMLQRYSASGDIVHSGELAIRIEHLGQGACFPLATADAKSAAGRALEIYRTIVKDGWEIACRKFTREVTVAIHWAGNPLGWTYATIHTVPSEKGNRPAPPAKDSGKRTVALVEPDASIRRALVDCLDRQAEFVCEAAWANWEDASREVPRHRPNLLLANHPFAASSGAAAIEPLQRLFPEMPVLFYSVFEDSEQLFKATPGGASGYLLKRTPPDRLLEPIFGIVGPSGSKAIEPAQISRSVRRYFQSLIESWPADFAPALARLTPREQQVLHLMSKGRGDKEIADALEISVWTVHGHAKNIFDKLGVHSRTEAVVRYLEK